MSWLPVDDVGRVDLAWLKTELDEHADEIALVTVMWANNEIGTVQPVAEVAALCADRGIPFHTDAVQAVGSLEVDASIADSLALSGPQDRRPGRRRRPGPAARLSPVPLVHGGGQEREVRSGTLDAAGIASLAAALTAVDGRLRRAHRPRRPAARRPRRPGARHGRRRHPQRRPARAGCPATRTCRSRAARATRCCCCSTPPASSARPGRPARPACRSPATCCSRWVSSPSPPAGRSRFSLGWSSSDDDVAPTRRGAARGRRRTAPGAAGGRTMRVVAALSGGVDSAVAAARAVDAGHDVIGVHLALARNPQSHRTGARGCCTLEDARDARRVADVLGIPFYVWDLSERFAEDVIDDFVAEYAAGRTPNPCLRCNEKIKFSAVLDRALALGFDAVATGHYARSSTALAGASCTARSTRPRTSRTCSACSTAEQLARRDVPARRVDQGRGAGRGRSAAACSSPTSPTATTSASSPTATPAGSCATGSARRPATSSTPSRGRCSAHHDGAYAFTVGQRRGLHLGRPADDGGRRYVVGVDVAQLHRARRTAGAARGRPGRGDPAALVRRLPGRTSRGHRAAARARRADRGRRVRGPGSTARCSSRRCAPEPAASRPARRSCSTTAPASSAAPPSAARRGSEGAASVRHGRPVRVGSAGARGPQTRRRHHRRLDAGHVVDARPCPHRRGRAVPGDGVPHLPELPARGPGADMVGRTGGAARLGRARPRGRDHAGGLAVRRRARPRDAARPLVARARTSTPSRRRSTATTGWVAS